MRWLLACLLVAGTNQCDSPAPSPAPVVITQPPQPQPPPSEIGRYHVIEGTMGPLKRAPILLDTVTGNTWTLCAGYGEPTQWCAITRDDGVQLGSVP